MVKCQVNLIICKKKTEHFCSVVAKVFAFANKGEPPTRVRPLLSLNRLRIHPLLRFLKAKGNFAVCGRRQGLLALDLGRFFCKKSSAKKLQKGFATSSNPVLFSTGFLIYNSTLLSCIRTSPSLYRWLISEKHLQVGAVTPFSLFLKSMMVTPVCVY